MSRYRNDPDAIYAESFRIIREEADLERFPADVERVVARMIHAAADPAIAKDIDFTPGVVAATEAALAAGAPILCDASMVATGIITSRLAANNEIICMIKDPRLAEIAKRLESTKAAAAVDQWQADGLLDGAIVAIGNAPTALFRLLDVIGETGIRPAAVFGIPVGFVGAAESKTELAENPYGLEFITLRGRRGGSAITVAALNAAASAHEGRND